MAYLILENGKIFSGRRIGAPGSSIGEIVFTTGMVGYLETLTDPSYAGQMVIQTFPLIGNYGVIEEDFEGECAVKGYILSEICDEPSNFRCQYKLDEYLKAKNVPGICGVDTRELTKLLREEGCMNAIICDEIPDDLEALKSFVIKDVLSEVTCKEAYTVTATKESRYKVALIDCGAKRNIIRSLADRGCDVTVYPCTVTAEEILAGGYDGLMLSNGPGNPEDNVELIAQIKKLVGNIPIFGICLGHQLTALAMGGKTQKLKYGHHGVNQPVKDVRGTRTYITSQNHNYAVVAESLRGIAEVSFINANDGSCEGVEYVGKNCFTVQFHPEAASGPLDTAFLFDDFIKMMEGKKNA